MSNNQVIGLKTLKMQSTINTPQKSLKKRVFTEDEWLFLQTLETEELEDRINKGDFVIQILSSPEMMNMTSKEANALASNLKFQQDAIREIIKNRSLSDG